MSQCGKRAAPCDHIDPSHCQTTSSGVVRRPIRRYGIEILDGVVFGDSAVDALERSYNWEHMFDPASIGVVLGKTKVGIDGDEFVVESCDCGEYTLSDGRVAHQWDVLENGIDGVTPNNGGSLSTWSRRA